FVISLSSLRVLPNQWSLLSDALAAATTPPMQLSNKTRVSRGSSSFRRFGGCGGAVRLELKDCDLSQAHFRAPRAIPEDTGRPASIARSARREWSKGAGRRSSAKSLATRARSAAGEELTASPSSSSYAFRPRARDANGAKVAGHGGEAHEARPRPARSFEASGRG
ncbi:unnamed protein product, partial [Durusdinium trenchii]